MNFNVISWASVTIFVVALLVAGAVAHRRGHYDKYVGFSVAALVVTGLALLASAFWADSQITTAVWALNVAIQASGVIQARRHRREWLSWQDHEAKRIAGMLRASHRAAHQFDGEVRRGH